MYFLTIKHFSETVSEKFLQALFRSQLCQRYLDEISKLKALYHYSIMCN